MTAKDSGRAAILFIAICIANGNQIYPKRIENESLKSCLKVIVEKYGSNGQHVGVYMEGDLGEIMLNIFETRVLYGLTTNLRFKLERVKMYFIVLKYSKASYIFKQFSNLSTWNPRAKFIIISEMEDRFEILKQAVTYYVKDVVVVDIPNFNQIDLYTWVTFETICKNKFTIEKLDTCVNGIFFEGGDLFKKVFPKTWNGCSLKILAMIITPYTFYNKQNLDGLEVRCLKTIQSKMGFQVNFLSHTFRTWGLRTPNGTYTDMFRSLQKYEADIVMGMWPTNFTHTWDFDVTISYLQDALVWLVPKAQTLPHWKRLAIIFNKSIWISMFLFILFLPLLWAIGGRFLRRYEVKSFLNWHSGIFKSLSVILCVSLPKFPKTITLRIMFIIWVYMGLILVTLYQSKLLAILIQPQYEEQISDAEELLASGMQFGANVNVKALYDATVSQTEKELYEKMVNCDLTLTCPNRTAFQRDFATAKAKLAAKFLILQYFSNPDGSPKIYIFESTILSHYINVVFSKGHPMFEQFNQILYWIYECGLLLKWMGDIKDEKMRKAFIGKIEEDKSLVLSLQHMGAPFKILLIGYALSAILLVVENIYFRAHKKIK